MKFPEHKCGMYLTHNAYKDIYQTIEQAVSEMDRDNHWLPGERDLALLTGEIWELQWYPNTPVGFYRVIGSTLEAVMAGAVID